MKVNQTKAKLARGETVFGIFLRYPSASLAEFVSYLGWDFVLFDAEHSSMGVDDCENMARAVEGRGVTAMTRVHSTYRHDLLKYMDTGLGGIQAPMVESADQARAIVRAVKYQPIGERGLAGTRAADFGQGESLSDYIQTANRESMVVVQIESRAGVESAEAICGVDGIDVIFLGPTDLANSLGVTGQMDHPTLMEAICHVRQCVCEHDKVLGAYVANLASAGQWMADGARYIATTTEAMLAPASRAYLSSVREMKAVS